MTPRGTRTTHGLGEQPLGESNSPICLLGHGWQGWDFLLMMLNGLLRKCWTFSCAKNSP